MGLSVVVGMLAELREEDEEAAQLLRESFDRVNLVLAERRLPPHHEPECLPVLRSRSGVDGFPYSCLHYLRRAYARRLNDPSWVATPVAAGEEASHDPLVKREYARMKSHLVCHSDAEGYYLPLDFQPVVIDAKGRVPGAAVGSSYRLREELIYVAPALSVPLAEGGILSDADAAAINQAAEAGGPLSTELMAWLCLYEAARLSIEHKSAVSFA